MNFVLVLIMILIAVAIVGVIFFALRSSSRGGAAIPAQSAAPGARVRPAVAEFHVRGDTAHVHFAVPLPEGPVDTHLRAVLEHEAVAVLRDKRDRGLPLEGVEVVVTYGRRGDESVEVGRIHLPAAGTLPEVVAPDLLPHDHAAGFDPLAILAEQEMEVVPGVTVREEEGPLPPASQVVELPRSLEVALRAQGIDPAAASLSDLVLGLLNAAGYQVTPERTGLASAAEAAVYRATRGGATSVVCIVEHGAGDHPELGEGVINEMIVLAGQGNAGGFLVTDKYGPYLMYEKERRSRVRYITRERLQAFVDSFALRS